MNVSKTQPTTLTQIVTGLGNTATKYDGKSLRLHVGKGNATEDHVNVHKKTDNIFSNSRIPRRQGALELVKTAMQSEYNLSDKQVTDLLGAYNVGGDRISFGQLKDIHQALQARDAEITRAQNGLGISRDTAEALVGNISWNADAQSLARIHSQLDIIIGLAPHKNAISSAMNECAAMVITPNSTVSDQAKTALARLAPAKDADIGIKSLILANVIPKFSELPNVSAKIQEFHNQGTVQEIRNLVQDLETQNKDKRNYNHYGVTGNADAFKGLKYVMSATENAVRNITGYATEAISAVNERTFDQNGVGQTVGGRVGHWEGLRSDNTLVSGHTMNPIQYADFQNGDISGQLNLGTDKWKIAESGSSGALVIRDNNLPNSCAVLKYEASNASECALKISSFMDSVMDTVGGTGNQSFEMAGLAEVDVNQVKDDLKDKLTQMKQTASPLGKEKLEDHILRLDGHPNSDCKLTKLVMVEGSDMRKLPPADKLAQLRSPKFAQGIGEIMVMGRIFGLNDHVPLTSVDANMAFRSGNSNVSNLMISSTTGKPVLIDFSTSNDDITDPQTLTTTTQYGFPDKETLNAFTQLSNFARGLNSAQAIDDMLNLVVDDLNNGTDSTPLSKAARLFLTPGAEHMFGGEDAYVGNKLSDADKKAFAANLLLGAIDGMSKIAQNQGAIAGCAIQTGFFMQNPMSLMQNVSTAIGNLAPIRQQLVNHIG